MIDNVLIDWFQRETFVTIFTGDELKGCVSIKASEIESVSETHDECRAKGAVDGEDFYPLLIRTKSGAEYKAWQFFPYGEDSSKDCYIDDFVYELELFNAAGTCDAIEMLVRCLK